MTSEAPDSLFANLDLLVLQATPFCNLDCSYCYLPNRDDKRRMSMETLRDTLRMVASGGLATETLSIVWHAGEPLVVGRDYYREAFAVVAECVPAGTRIRHQFQTNAVLLDDAWCEFIAEHEISIGVSIDGPAHIHDARRKTRNGKGTHAAVMRGIDALKRHGIPFHTIGVISRESLPHADAIYDFFSSLGATQVGFNVEEIEAGHTSSSLEQVRTAEFKRFFARIVERWQVAPSPLRIREIQRVLDALVSPEFGSVLGSDQSNAGRILSVSSDGEFTTWSPELLGSVHPTHGSLSLGSVARGLDAPARRKLAVIQDEIDRGRRACRDACKFFSFCLGGAPANKLGEHATFAATETMFCRLTEKVVVSTVLESLDASLVTLTPAA